MTTMETFIQRGSGWVIKEVESLEVTFNRTTPLAGATYMDLPKFIGDKKA